MGGDDHRCEWRGAGGGPHSSLRRAGPFGEATAAVCDARTARRCPATVEKLQRHVFGKRSEKMPPVAEAIRDPSRAEADRLAALQTRRENAEKKRLLVTRTRAQGQRRPEDRPELRRARLHAARRRRDDGLYELVPAMVERQAHIQEKLRCRCGKGIVIADGPEKVYDKARFGPAFMAQVVVRSAPTRCPSIGRRRRTGASAYR